MTFTCLGPGVVLPCSYSLSSVCCFKPLDGLANIKNSKIKCVSLFLFGLAAAFCECRPSTVDLIRKRLQKDANAGGTLRKKGVNIT